MSLEARTRRPVIIFHRTDSGDVDEAGDARPSEDAVETVAELQPRDTTERPTHPDVAESDWLGWFLIADAPFLNAASSVWAPYLGEYEIVGKPAVWDQSTDPYVEVNLKQTAGAIAVDEGSSS